MYGEEQDSQRIEKGGPQMQQQDDYGDDGEEGDENYLVDEDGNPIPPELIEEYMR